MRSCLGFHNQQTYIGNNMTFIGTENFDHEQAPQVGILLTNLGTPASPDKQGCRRFLKEFLWDHRVVEIPRPVWWLILNGVILNVRPARSAAAYRSVWTDRGSPLLYHTEDQTSALRNTLQAEFGERVTVEFAMRYGTPAIADVLQNMLQGGVRKLLVLPLYPQYSATTTGSTFDAIAADLHGRRWIPDLRFITHYHDNPAYIDAVANSVRVYREEHGQAEKLVFSFHGLPKRNLEEGDPYHCECLKTSRLIAEKLGLAEDDYLTTFQSRFGRQEWLQPYTDKTLEALPEQGVKSVQIVCPGFSADCLETLEEIALENRDTFTTAGGERYDYIPCLNAQPAHIDALAGIVRTQIADWLQAPP